MKKIILVIMVGAFLVGLAGSAYAGMYVGGNLGLTMPRKSTIKDVTSPGVEAELTVDDGLGLALTVGSDFGRSFRYEGEFAHRQNDVSEVEVGGSTFPFNAEITGMSLMGNIYWDIRSEATVCPYLGFGLGMAKLEGQMETDPKEDDTVFAYQFILGTAFNVSEKVAIDLNLRYYGTDNPTFGDIEAEYQTLDLFTGVRVSF